MKRGLLLSAMTLVAMWLLLNGSPSFGQLVLGVLLALAVLAASAPLRPMRPHPRRALTAILLLTRVVADIVRSNIAVAGIILGPKERRSNAGFMKIPLDMRSPHGLAALACIITATPGTVWSGLSDDGSTLTLHVLDLQDETVWINTIKYRYERALMEIFE